MRGFVGAVAAVALSSALCAGAPRVAIQVVSRPQMKKIDSPVLAPIPSRDALPAFQGKLGNWIKLCQTSAADYDGVILLHVV